jgi:hypothetical protein
MTSAMHFLAILLLGTSCMSLALSCIMWKDAILQVIRMMVNWDACMHTYIEYTWEDDDRKNPRQCPRSNHVVVAWTPPKRYSGQPAESIRTCLRQHCQSIQSFWPRFPILACFYGNFSPPHRSHGRWADNCRYDDSLGSAQNSYCSWLPQSLCETRRDSPR